MTYSLLSSRSLPLDSLGRLSASRGRVTWSGVSGTAVWLLVGASAAYWGLQLVEDRVPVPVPRVSATQVEVDSRAVALALGGGAQRVDVDTAPAPAVTARYTLHGVAADAQGHGVALLAAPGSPVVALRVGAQLPDGWCLESLSRDEAVMAGPGGTPRVSLKMLPGAN